ncbi:MAG: phosphoribosylformylglycinamidine synthase II [Candidatus Magasanikbacteria bacterium RIFCSPHIGHO2_01_FULL_33_34]|uniref:Phosphoribosylformylglycinamidine synthase subunit PurL n=1 Tax=Candidatus Magasanikbacteria bacterium RIFCSPHIGHO2_01_FULL_33_34 TaxID=1798671 RepID=A0A1F6LHS4_9BACT|nr:MAG: phosphoribosylformylglycinamidine synthase II [Candidatus Magasanikbacteria bacterium RIFCSPHIGHO2_01_FULL_33_34]OGH65227.1 MAG: phosphoribosylformylglycinamidine synthase II [Candidatus Magasanikbacteria bacterium RIFCSPHIGHO2_02_FULL_33_17]OGH75419.1 MAG: phosphoribosylformylglycinamidine synthase II [Candidatus Magasanikbacteria bacterium RIFCSPLOWO2_01_FULL_33_34]OGH81734.1 MAG: phosphoribosylformylglycinamidine synthase II [Candidatus Magasanikbacteria bacterium RIFCSPLOWO2_12_FULL_
MNFTTETIDFAKMNQQEIKNKLNEYRIALTVDEILKIQNEILKRPPSITECILWSIQGSEHCSYKSSRPFLEQFITKGPNVILGPSEDAGIVEIAKDHEGNKYGIVISHESHNHPSQIVPYEGAATGIGGNVRDVSCMGAKVIAIADPLRFGEIKNNKTKWIHEGVVSGIAGYGNPIGVPNIGGDVYYNKKYNDNCLVNVVTLGVLREDEIIHSKAPKNSTGYNLILIGKPTDNSGFGGASFASLELNEKEKEKNKGAVQEPNAFLKRHLLKANNELFKILKEKNLINKVGFKDLGAGGIACAAVELADSAGLGAEINLDLAHRSMENLHPSVLLCSETQERFMWVVSPEITDLVLDHYNKTFDLPKVSEGAKATVIGKIKDDDQFIVKYKNQEIVHARASDITKGLLYNRNYEKPNRNFSEPNIPEMDYNTILLKILSHENVASRSPIYEKYDKNVQGISVIEPGEADAGVIQPFKDDTYPEEIKSTGVALSVDHNPRYSIIDPYWGGINAVAEAVRNIACVGATPQAITDCLNFGNPEKPEQMWEFTEGVKGVADACKNILLKENGSPIPIISGNVSLYNESEGKAIAPSPIIACLGKLEDTNKAITMHFKNIDSIIVMVGKRKDECGGSVYYDLHNELGANIPKPKLNEVRNQVYALTDCINRKLILGAHDISDGGIVTTLAEMSFKNEIGFDVNIPGEINNDKKMFSETGGFVFEVEISNFETVEKIFKSRVTQIFKIGKTTENKQLKINNLINIDLKKAKRAWKNGLRNKL